VKYLLMIYREEAEVAAMPEHLQAQGTAAYRAYGEALAKAGAMLGGERLRPISAATTVRIRDGKTQVLDGPYAETKEQLGGYFIIDVPDLDSALNWAARCPGASYGTMEVRPIWEM
jgi:hypothetical protein